MCLLLMIKPSVSVRGPPPGSSVCFYSSPTVTRRNNNDSWNFSVKVKFLPSWNPFVYVLPVNNRRFCWGYISMNIVMIGTKLYENDGTTICD